MLPNYEKKINESEVEKLDLSILQFESGVLLQNSLKSTCVKKNNRVLLKIYVELNKDIEYTPQKLFTLPVGWRPKEYFTIITGLSNSSVFNVEDFGNVLIMDDGNVSIRRVAHTSMIDKGLRIAIINVEYDVD